MEPVFRYRPFELELDANLPEGIEIPLLDRCKCVILTPDLAILLGNVDSLSFDSESILQCFLLRRNSNQVLAVELLPQDQKKVPAKVVQFFRLCL
jgi:hypothetical protein